jgi:phosphoglycerate kinase
VSPQKTLRTIQGLSVGGRRVFLRSDLNVPLADGRIGDDTRIRASRETFEYLREQGARVVMASHLGRPKKQVRPELSLRPVAEAFGIPLAPDCIGEEVARAVSELGDGDAILLENLRFHAGEEENAPEFVAELAKLADVYVNDAFGTAHRAHASTAGLALALPEAAAGFLLSREVSALSRVRENPERPYICILGGAKVSDKLAVMEALAERADLLCVGGAMAYTFLLARGQGVGESLVEPELVDTARRLLEGETEILLPVDHVVAAGRDDASGASTVESIPDGKMALDVGPKTIANITARLKNAGTVFWNGPLGLFETPPFHRGTEALARALAASAAYSVVGGGDSLAAVQASGVADQISHLSTGGGASLEFLEGRTLPGIEALEEER